MSQPTLNDLYAALLSAIDNATILAHEIDSAYGTHLADSIPVLSETPPSTTGSSGGPVYNANGLTSFDSDGLVGIKAVEDFRSQNIHSNLAQVRNLATALPHRWFIQDTLDAINDPTNPVFFQVQANTNTARTYLSMRAASRRAFYTPVYKAVPAIAGLWTRGDLLTDAGAFSGDFLLGDKVIWKGVRAADVPAILAILLQKAIENPTIDNK